MPTIQFMSADAAQALKEPTRILRVAFRHSNYQGFKITHKAVKEVFVEPDARIDGETCQAIVEFIEEAVAAGDDIVIHCTEGRYRSRAIANFVWRHYRDYEHVGKEWEGGEMRDLNYRSLQEWHVLNRKEVANV
jgi:predicted protein tyrosine phosphatase